MLPLRPIFLQPNLPGWINNGCLRVVWLEFQPATDTMGGDYLSKRDEPLGHGSDAGKLVLFDNLKNHLAVGSRSCGVENRADGFCRSTLLADNPSQIFLGHS